MKIDRLLTNICSNDLSASKAFYTSLFELKVAYDSDWFVQLVSEENGLELGIIQNNHELIPAEFRGSPTGVYLTFVVESADAIYEKAQTLGFDIIQSPEMTFYGQKRLLLKDPSGTLIDVSSPENG